MLVASSPLFSPHQWPLDDPISFHHQHNYHFSLFEPSDHSFHVQFSPPPLQLPHVELDNYPSIATPLPDGGTKVSNVAKKLSHNASERDRRKKINSLYSSLRSLLPSTDHMKLSNPATISRILSYIPELQQQVEGLMRKKEELMTAMVGQEVDSDEEKRKKCAATTSSSSIISATRLGRREMAVQICTDIDRGHRNSLSELFVCLEEDGLLLWNASSFESFDGKVFHNLHLQMESSCRVEPEMVSIKILEMFHERERGNECAPQN